MKEPFSEFSFGFAYTFELAVVACDYLSPTGQSRMSSRAE